MECVIKCTKCYTEKDFKCKSKFDRVKIDNFLCSNCKNEIRLKNRTRICENCKEIIIYSSPGNMRLCKNSLKCKKCNSNQIPSLFTSEQQEFFNGLMLGDGSLVYPNKNGSLYPRLIVARQLQDKEYLDWQYETFKDFYLSPPSYFKSFHNRVKKHYEGYAARTRTGQLFKNLREKWYPNNKKIIPRDLKLTPLTLLIWFLDDGCIVKSSKNGLVVKFSTDGFSKEDVKYIASLLENFINEKIHIYKNGNGLILKGSTLVAIKIIEIIDPIFPSFMKRKRTWHDFDFEHVKQNNKLYKSRKKT